MVQAMVTVEVGDVAGPHWRKQSFPVSSLTYKWISYWGETTSQAASGGGWFCELGIQQQHLETCRMEDRVSLFTLGEGASRHSALEMGAGWRGGSVE